MPIWILIFVVAVIVVALIYLLTRNSSTATNSDALQSDAKRFARLLVTEIKLYNESKIERGKRDNDIYSHLAAEIDNARTMFDKRINSGLMEKDYLDEEIIKELADGDSGKMGEQYVRKNRI